MSEKTGKARMDAWADGYTEGWNDAIQDAENALRESGRPQGCIRTVRGLAKPAPSQPTGEPEQE